MEDNPFYKSKGINRCNGKGCYDKKGAMTVRNRRWEEDRVDLRIYDCPDCDFWHLTSNTDGKRYGKFKGKN